MVKKSNQTQRVKGNLKPTSSSRAAELSATGTFGNLPASTNIGFSHFSTDNNGPEPEFLGGEIGVIFKRLSKRDTTTKLKALEDLETYVKTSDAEILLEAFQAWPKVYSRNSIEIDRRVRATINGIHLLFVQKLKKKIAPTLKEFIGPWVCSFFDPSKDVSRIALESFQTAFPPSKRSEVFGFCQASLLDYITENILEKTPETLSDPRFTSKEDTAAKYGRVISSSFYALGHLLENISPSDLEKLQPKYNHLLDATKMWQFFTHENPLIRRSCYSLIKTVVTNCPALLEVRLEISSAAFLAKVFQDKDTTTHSEMWDAILLYTKAFPQAWVLAGRKKPMLPKLWAFLRAGGYGSISISFPSLIALVAHLPQELIEGKFFEELFNSLWSSLQSGQVDKSNFHTFVDTYCECLYYFLLRFGQTDKAIGDYLIRVQATELITRYLTQEQIGDMSVGVSNLLVKIYSNPKAQELGSEIWKVIEELIINTITSEELPSKSKTDFVTFSKKSVELLVALSRKAQSEQGSSEISQLINNLMMKVLLSSLGMLNQECKHKATLCDGSSRIIQELLPDSLISSDVQNFFTEQFPTLLLKQEELSSVLCDIFIRFIKKLEEATVNTELIIQQHWSNLIDLLLESENSPRQVILLSDLFSKADAIGMQTSICSEKLSKFVVAAFQGFLSEQEPNIATEALVTVCLTHPRQYIGDSEQAEIIRMISERLNEFSELEVHGEHVSKPTEGKIISTLLRILDKSFSQEQFLRDIIDVSDPILINIFRNQFIKHDLDTQNEEDIQKIRNHATECWKSVVKLNSESRISDQKIHLQLTDLLISNLKKALLDPRHTDSPNDFVRKASQILSDIFNGDSGSASPLVESLLFDEAYWNDLGRSFVDAPVNPALRIMDPLLNTLMEANANRTKDTTTPYDIYGLSIFGRVSLFVVELWKEVGHEVVLQSTGERVWLLLQLVMVQVLCKQSFDVRPEDSCQIWTSDSHVAENVYAFHGLIEDISAIIKEFMESVDVELVKDTKWVEQVKGALIRSSPDGVPLDPLGALVYLALQKSHQSGNPQWAKALEQILFILSSHVVLPEQSIDAWLNLIQDTDVLQLHINTKLAILQGLSPVLARSSSIRNIIIDLNEQLSAMVDPSEDALNPFVVSLLTTAMNSQVTIPQHVLTNILKALNRYYANSDKSSTELNTVVAQLLGYMVPQFLEVTVPMWTSILELGSQWITNGSDKDPKDLALKYYALKLILILQDMSEEYTNLKEAWKAVQPKIHSSVLEILIQLETDVPKAPASRYLEILSEIGMEIPLELLLSVSNERLYSLLRVPHESVQKLGYHTLRLVTLENVRETSINLELDMDNELAPAKLPTTLMEHLIHPPSVASYLSGDEEHFIHTCNLFGYLLAWMNMYDHFEESSFQVKSHHVDQLREVDALPKLLVVIFELLGLNGNATFDLSKWRVDSFQVQGLDYQHDFGLQLLAGHVYFRTLMSTPSLVRSWWIESRNRQLNLLVDTYTEKYFSEMIIQEELQQIQRDDVKSQLEDDNMGIRISRTNDVTATYKIDDTSLEMVIRLPTNFPLRQVDVEGTRRVAVTEARWRSWLLAVTSVIVSQNGSILDALTLFKRNISLHFEGVEDCTICYSVVGVIDRSLPTRQCKTCKNKFHSACLFKWFRTSNQSTCPLCRNLF
ncbi:hypothetical protein K7432_002034 [Basidiobolus ranarum]|uniref:E3 ubiquitin-protein ligase listerin n=1 Tax=Basidiobolus ranarum TaxID=34480 RepID=A0ABR2W8V4_9FUNG